MKNAIILLNNIEIVMPIYIKRYCEKLYVNLLIMFKLSVVTIKDKI